MRWISDTKEKLLTRNDHLTKQSLDAVFCDVDGLFLDSSFFGAFKVLFCNAAHQQFSSSSTKEQISLSKEEKDYNKQLTRTLCKLCFTVSRLVMSSPFERDVQEGDSESQNFVGDVNADKKKLSSLVAVRLVATLCVTLVCSRSLFSFEQPEENLTLEEVQQAVTEARQLALVVLRTMWKEFSALMSCARLISAVILQFFVFMSRSTNKLENAVLAIDSDDFVQTIFHTARSCGNADNNAILVTQGLARIVQIFSFLDTSVSLLFRNKLWKLFFTLFVNTADDTVGGERNSSIIDESFEGNNCSIDPQFHRNFAEIVAFFRNFSFLPR